MQGFQDAPPSPQASLSTRSTCVWGSGFRVQGSGFRVRPTYLHPPPPVLPAGLAAHAQQLRVWFRVQGSGFRVQGSGFRVQGSRFRIQGPGFRVVGCRDFGMPGEWCLAGGNFFFFFITLKPRVE